MQYRNMFKCCNEATSQFTTVVKVSSNLKKEVFQKNNFFPKSSCAKTLETLEKYLIKK